MSTVISNWDFLGPFIDTDEVESKPGIYLLVKVKDEELDVLYMGSSNTDLKDELSKNSIWHDRTELNIQCLTLYLADKSTDAIRSIQSEIEREYF